MDITFETSVMSADGTTATGTCKLGDIANVGHRQCTRTPSPARTRPSTSPLQPTRWTATTPRFRPVSWKKLDAFALSDEMPEGCSLLHGR